METNLLAHQVDKVLVADLPIGVGQRQEHLQLVRVQLRAVGRQKVPEALGADEARTLGVVLQNDMNTHRYPQISA